MITPPCPLCQLPESGLLWSNGRIHVITVDDSGFPGYTRVIWAAHQPEMTDLDPAQRNQLMQVVWQVEQTQRHLLHPDKINLAQFGNMVPHLHWHVIPRWQSDSHFPEAVWAPAPSATPERQALWHGQYKRLQATLPTYHQALSDALDQLDQNP